MTTTEKTPLLTQVKLLAICLLGELALCGTLNAARLHFLPAAEEMARDLAVFMFFWTTGSIIVLNVASMAAAAAAIVRKRPFRRFAAVSLPFTLAATALLVMTYLFGGAQRSAAVALAAYLLALAINRFVPGRIWPPEAVQ